MKTLIIGAAGMVGRKLTNRILAEKGIGGKEVSSLLLHDVIQPETPKTSIAVEVKASDLSVPGEAEKLIASKPEMIFHLAAIVSGEAEADFEKGYRINLDGTRYLLEAIRKANYKPRLVFTSSIAVFGAPFPEAIGDEFLCAPLTSYGTQKAICELLISDYTRKGILDGVAIRLPTICVRPGKPNKAASGFFSNIIREPLAGAEAVLPVSEDVRHWFSSPRAAVNFLMRAAVIEGEMLGNRRAISMPGLSCTVGEQIAALKKIAGENVVKRIKREPDQTIIKIVDGWAQNFDTKRALSLGFKAESNFEEIVQAHIEDELGGEFVK
jgi:nucleoside-diphosphate-sugar epimerase